MTQGRVKGFVVGYDRTRFGFAWTVRVKDEKSEHNGKKFLVHSGEMLTKPAVDVTFKIEPAQVGQKRLLRATDVRISFPVRVELEKKEDEKFEEVSSDTLNVVVTQVGDDIEVWTTGCGSAKEVERELGSDERVVAFLPFDIRECEDDEDIIDAFEVIKALCLVQETRDSLEKLLAAVFKLGCKHSL